LMREVSYERVHISKSFFGNNIFLESSNAPSFCNGLFRFCLCRLLSRPL
jgi:hypothetical protein